MGKYNFQNHPLKDEMLKMFEDGKNPYHVEDFLKKRGDEFLLSRPTLYKHYNNYKRATKVDDSEDKNKEEFKNKLVQELWSTINHCNLAMQDKSLTPKEWQYFDQQKQSAIEKLTRLKAGAIGSGEDASVILAKFFQKFTIDKILKEAEEKDDSAEKDNNEQGTSGDLLPGESVPV